jgi:hypothetical protein
MLFLHMPKTGGSWVTQAVSAAGVATWAPDPLGDRSYSAHGHADLNDVDVGDRLSVAFIRHPLDWWRSYWGHRMRAGWDRTIGIDAVAASNDFNRFVLALLDDHRGSFDEIVGRFIERFYPDDPTPANLLEGAMADPCSPLLIKYNHRSGAYNRQRSEERVRTLERALSRSRQNEASLQRALTEARTERDQAACALESLRNSRLMRRTRTLRSAYYRAREPHRPSSDHRSPAASTALSE